MTLQQELTNSESVQKDFVKLSQQLQVRQRHNSVSRQSGCLSISRKHQAIYIPAVLYHSSHQLLLTIIVVVKYGGRISWWPNIMVASKA